MLKFIIFYLFAVQSLGAQSIYQGSWDGAFVREGSVQRTDFHLTHEDGSLTGYHNIPERSLYREPLTDIRQEDRALYLQTRYGPFRIVKATDPDQLLGESVQWNPKIRLHLKKSDPEEPYFLTRDFVSENGRVTLKGKVYEPVGQPSKDILIVLVHGSGPVVMSDRYYRTEALSLVRRGYHVAVYDKRGNGASTGDIQDATLSDFADDAVSVLATVKPQYGKKLIGGFLGISQGGWVSTIAANRTGQHDFLILNVGPAVSLFQQEIDRVHFTLQQNGYDTKAITQAVEHVELMFELVDDASLWSRYLDSSKNMQALGLSETVNTSDEEDDADLSWWRANRYDPGADLQKLSVPVLSLLGGADPLVPPATNRRAMECFLQNSQSPFYQIAVFDNAYHNLQVFGSLKNDNWNWPSGYWVWQHKAEGLYPVIDEFLDNLKLDEKESREPKSC